MAPLLRLRSDAQLVAMFRAGHDEAFRVIHDRYRQRLFAYTRQMLAHRQDAEDALQDVFVRAYSGLRASDRDLALRAWLYRVAHNRCIDELRRPVPPSPELLELMRPPVQDPIAEADRRESLRRLITDVRRLPGQQRSALLMRELGGMSYVEIADALGVSIAAVKSLLVRARLALAEALEARDTACSEIQAQLSLARDRGVRPGAMAKRHMRDCDGCRQFHRELRVVGRQFAAITPAAGPLGALAKLIGLGGLGSGAGSYAAAGGGAAAAGGAAGTGAVATGVLATGSGHVATLLAAAIVTAGGAVEIQHTFSAAPVQHRHQHHQLAQPASPRPASRAATAAAATGSSRAVPARRTLHHTTGAVASKAAGARSAPAKDVGVKKTATHAAPAAPATRRHPKSGSKAHTGTKDTSGPIATPILSMSASQAGTAGTATSGSDTGVCTAGTVGTGGAGAATGGAGTTGAGTTSTRTATVGATSGTETTAGATANGGRTSAGTSSASDTSASATSTPAATGGSNSSASTSCVASGAGSTTSTTPSTASTPTASGTPSNATQSGGAAATGSGTTPTASGSSQTTP